MSKVKCPKWGCDGIGMPIDTKKKFSVGKAFVENTIGGFFGPVGAVYNSSNFKIYFKEEYQHLVSLSSAAYMWLILGAGILVCGIALRNANIQYIKQNNND